MLRTSDRQQVVKARKGDAKASPFFIEAIEFQEAAATIP